MVNLGWGVALWLKKTCVKIYLGKKNDFGQKIFLVTTIFDKKKCQKILLEKLSNKILVKKF